MRILSLTPDYLICLIKHVFVIGLIVLHISLWTWRLHINCGSLNLIIVNAIILHTFTFDGNVYLVYMCGSTVLLHIVNPLY